MDVKCKWCEEKNSEGIPVEPYMIKSNKLNEFIYGCLECIQENTDPQDRTPIVFPDGIEIISTEERRSLETDVNRLHYVEQAILGAAKMYKLETGYRITEVFASIRRKLDSRIKLYKSICFDYGIDPDCHPFARPSSASCPKCTNKMVHFDGYRIKDALYVGMHEDVKRCDIIVCFQCGHVFVGKFS